MPATPQQKSGCLGALLLLFNPSQSGRQVQISPLQIPTRLPYRVRDDFLSTAEHSFLLVLRAAIGDTALVQVKVNLGDVFYVVSRDRAEWQAYRNKIDRKHVDFLLCDPKTMHPVAGIELDDTSHQKEDRQERDEFVDTVFKDAELPLIRFRVRREYSTTEVAAKIAPFLKVQESPSPVQPRQPEPVQAELVPICSKCGIPMVLRTVAQGQYKGRQFYGCENYPRCREMRPVRVQMERPEEVVGPASRN